MAAGRVGVIGLGLMGSAMAKRLVERGYAVVGYDIVPEKTEAAVAFGVDAQNSPADVAQRCDVVILSLVSTAAVAEVIEGDGGILEAGAGRAARLIVDTSTSEIGETRRLAELVRERLGSAFVDAPVSGGPMQAAAGTLAIMAGGTPGAIAGATPVMTDLGAFAHLGPVGAGQATKLINQTLVLNNYIVIAEAMRLAEAYGVDAKKVPGALAAGHAGSNLLPVMFDRMARRDWTPTGYARQVLKDLEMVAAAGKEKGLSQPMTVQALTLFRMLVGAGNGEIDGAAVLDLLPEAKKKDGAA